VTDVEGGDGLLIAFPLPPISSLSIWYISHRAVYLFCMYTCHNITFSPRNHHLRRSQWLEYSNMSTLPVNTFHLRSEYCPHRVFLPCTCTSHPHSIFPTFTWFPFHAFVLLLGPFVDFLLHP
jgi:hypothetical protein